MLHLETLPTTTKGKTMTKTCKLVIVPEAAWCECSPFPQAIHGRLRCPSINIAQSINGWLHLQFLSTTKVSTMSQRYLSASTVTPPTLLYISSRMMQQQEISIHWVMSLRFAGIVIRIVASPVPHFWPNKATSAVEKAYQANQHIALFPNVRSIHHL